MIPRVLGGLFVLAALAAPFGAARLLPPVEAEASTPASVLARVADTTRPVSGAKMLLALAEEQTPFRPDGELPALRFGESPAPPSTPLPVKERPKLLVSGIMMGAEPVAIMEGIPGQEQPVPVTTGMIIGGLRIARILAEEVMVVGQDTTWMLAVRNPW